MIVAIGDSITAGQHLHPASAWPYRVRGYGIRAAGVPGDTTRLGLERFPKDVQAFEPTAVIIQFGHNDANRWATDRGLCRVSLAAYKANLAEMIERARAFGAQPYLCTLTPTFRPDPHPEDCARYDRMLRRVADDEDVPLIDVREMFLSYPYGCEGELVMDDGLHLTEKGHSVFADTVRMVLAARTR